MNMTTEMLELLESLQKAKLMIRILEERWEELMVSEHLELAVQLKRQLEEKK